MKKYLLPPIQNNIREIPISGLIAVSQNNMPKDYFTQMAKSILGDSERIGPTSPNPLKPGYYNGRMTESDGLSAEMVLGLPDDAVADLVSRDIVAGKNPCKIDFYTGLRPRNR